MAGLILIFSIVLWIIFALKITQFVVCKVSHPVIKSAAGFAFFYLLIILPVADEVVAKYKYNDLCEKYNKVVVNEKIANNAEVSYSANVTNRHEFGGVRFTVIRGVYTSNTSREIVASYHFITATGGFLKNFIGMPEIDRPFFFTSGCAPKNIDEIKKKYQINVKQLSQG